MKPLKIKIQAISDIDGKPTFEGMTKENSEEALDMNIAIQEKGTTGGQTTVMFVLTDSLGKNLIGQMTANQFDGLVGAFNGAQERFKNESDG